MSAHRLHVVYTDDARSDLRDILLYTEQEWGKPQRTIYRRLIRDTLRTLARTPSLGRGRDELSDGLRSYPIRSHILYDWERYGVLTIARILHSRRDASRNAWTRPSAGTDPTDFG